jgi:amino acid permease
MVVNLVNSVLGSGILGLPVAFASTGWILGYILIVLAAAASSFSLHLLTLCGKKVPRPASFDAITEAAFPGYGYIVDIVVSCLCFGNATSYLIVMSNLMPEVMHYFKVSMFWQTRQVWVSVGLCIVGPLSYKKSLDALEFTNSLGLASVLFITVIIVAYSMHFPALDPCADDPVQCEMETTEYFSLTGSTISYLGVFVFSYTCQMVMFTAYCALFISRLITTTFYLCRISFLLLTKWPTPQSSGATKQLARLF